jgi:L-fuculose-phosphate aldolase
MITASGIPKGRMTGADLLTVNLAGEVVEGSGRPSSEIQMHLTCYRSRSDIAAVVHSHAPYATAFAAADQQLPADVLPEAVLFVGEIPLTEYAPPGTEAVGQSLAPYLKDNNAFLLRNHGLLTIGRTLDEAMNRHETVEHLARISWLANQIGGATPIPAEDLQRLTEMRLNQMADQK